MGKTIMVKGYYINEYHELEVVEVPKGKIGKMVGFDMIYSSADEAFSRSISNQEYALTNEEYKVKKRKEIIEKLKSEKAKHIDGIVGR